MQFYVLLSIAAMVQGQDNGGALEVPKGDLHINLGEAGSKVFVSIQGGPEIELFDLAARVKALEDAAGSPVDGGQVANNTESLSDLERRLSSTEKKVTNVQQDLSIVPAMAECASQSKIYHPEDAECKSPVSIHCDKLATDEDSNLRIPASALVDPEGCSFNQHYGGQSCGALCLPGSVTVPNADEDWTSAEIEFASDLISAGNNGHTCLAADQSSFIFDGKNDDSFSGTLEEAKELCRSTNECAWLHDFGGDGKGWRVCKHVRLGAFTGMVVKVNRGAKYECNDDGTWSANFKCNVPKCTPFDDATESEIDSKAKANGAKVQYRKESVSIDGTQNAPGSIYMFVCPRGKKVVPLNGGEKTAWSTCNSDADGTSASWSASFDNNDCA